MNRRNFLKFIATISLTPLIYRMPKKSVPVTGTAKITGAIQPEYNGTYILEEVISNESDVLVNWGNLHGIARMDREGDVSLRLRRTKEIEK